MNEFYKECPDCKCELTVYDYEIENIGETQLHIDIFGACPNCKKHYYWIENYEWKSSSNVKRELWR